MYSYDSEYWQEFLFLLSSKANTDIFLLSSKASQSIHPSSEFWGWFLSSIRFILAQTEGHFLGILYFQAIFTNERLECHRLTAFSSFFTRQVIAFGEYAQSATKADDSFKKSNPFCNSCLHRQEGKQLTCWELASALPSFAWHHTRRFRMRLQNYNRKPLPFQLIPRAHH